MLIRLPADWCPCTWWRRQWCQRSRAPGAIPYRPTTHPSHRTGTVTSFTSSTSSPFPRNAHILICTHDTGVFRWSGQCPEGDLLFLLMPSPITGDTIEEYPILEDKCPGRPVRFWEHKTTGHFWKLWHLPQKYSRKWHNVRHNVKVYFKQLQEMTSQPGVHETLSKDSVLPFLWGNIQSIYGQK